MPRTSTVSLIGLATVALMACTAHRAVAETKGYVVSWFSDPVPERGGRSKRYFRVQPLGIRALRQSRQELAAMWDGVELGKAMRGR